MPEDTAPRRAQLALGFDYGRRRIGVACGDTLSRSASPLATVPSVSDGQPGPAGSGGPRWDAIDALVREWQPALLVVGLPYNVDGSESPMSKASRAFAADLETRYGLPVHLIDERYSSLEAGSRLREVRASGARRRRVAKADVDAAAACVLLERWITEQP